MFGETFLIIWWTIYAISIIMVFSMTYDYLGPEGKVDVRKFLLVLFLFPQIYGISYLLDVFDIKRPENLNMVLVPLAIILSLFNVFFFLTAW